MISRRGRHMQQRILSELFAKYPREMAAYRRWISGAQVRSQYNSDPEPLAVIQKQLRAREAIHPETPSHSTSFASALRSNRHAGKYPHARKGTNTRAWIRMALARSRADLLERQIRRQAEVWRAIDEVLDRVSHLAGSTNARWMLVKNARTAGAGGKSGACCARKRN